MIQRTYESVVIVNAALEDDQIEVTLKKIEDNIQANGGSILDADKWGRKRLAYPIQKSKSGYYAVYRFEAPSELIAKLERHYQLDETIVRYLTIVLDKKALEFYSKEKEKSVAVNEVPEVSNEENDSKE
ncbi:MAG: 30S ribosomal protein S6 [Melioribacteraceae bacterium]|jgi:small subunit ribosomal protein S6|nr:30S ribosomal protein S6 [Melioribacteraceae bacterium]